MAVVFTAEAGGAQYTIEEDTTIGREGTEIVLDDPVVSRRHAAIRLTGDGASVEDLGSTHGTFVNDEKVMGRRPLLTGDRVRFGDVVWVALSGLPAAPADATIAPDMRGDVPMPTRVPSAILPAISAVPADAPFQPPGRGKRVRGSAARRIEMTAYSYGVVVATAVALGIYFAQR